MACRAWQQRGAGRSAEHHAALAASPSGDWLSALWCDLLAALSSFGDVFRWAQGTCTARFDARAKADYQAVVCCFLCLGREEQQGALL